MKMQINVTVLYIIIKALFRVSCEALFLSHVYFQGCPGTGSQISEWISEQQNKKEIWGLNIMITAKLQYQ